MSATEPQDARRAIAEHNVQAILDAAQRLLEAQEQPTISAVSAEAGLSRPTVYAHFPKRAQLIEAVVERAVARAVAAMRAARPEDGPAPEALNRLLAESWQQIALHADVAAAASAELSAEAMGRSHREAHEIIARILERGQVEGAFRADLDADWLVVCCLAIVHAAADQARRGRMSGVDALDALEGTILGLLAAG